MAATARRTTIAAKSFDGFSEEERDAMREHAKDLKAAARRGGKGTKADGEADVLAKIAEMDEADRVLAERVHAIVAANAPELAPKTWYGMPAYARDGKVVCFFQSAQKFKSRYATIGFSDQAALDEGEMWAVTYALTTLSPAVEARLAELVRRAAAAL
ncbi:iron chaperone [Kitasatospora sp. NPDC051853]|uniref:iron chaperone n=1 Tax=Kitasatospora sp. NPDC051853 TaxID=3364058 RepID=UPI0037AB4D54